VEWLKYAIAAVPSLLVAVFVYGKLSQQVESMHSQVIDTVKRLNPREVGINRS